MADEQSTQILSFNFGASTFAYRRVAEGLNRTPSAFKNFVRQYFDAVVKTDRYAQNVDDFGKAAHTADKTLT